MELLSPGIVLGAYAEPLLEGRRVVVFGDATSALPAELVERGARGVHVYDPEPARAALAAGQNRSKQISIVPLDEADVAVRDGAFDFAIVEDLSCAEEPAALLKRVRRALSQRGAAMIASPNPDAKQSLLPRTGATRGTSPIGYYDLFDAVSAEFAEVRMLGQTPFVGYAVVDFAPTEDPDVSIDSALVPGGAEEPEWFVALASRDPVECDAFGIVQLSAASVLGGKRAVDDELAAELRSARSNESRLVERVAVLEAECEALKSAPKAPPTEPLKERIAALEQELSKRATDLARLEAEKSTAGGRATAALAELETLRGKTRGGEKAEAELSKLGPEKQRLEGEVRAVTASRDSLTKQVSTLTAETQRLEKETGRLEKETGRLEKETGRLEKELSQVSAQSTDLAARLTRRDAELQKLSQVVVPSGEEEVSRLESSLKERGDRIRELEVSLRESERVGRELVREIEKNGRTARSAPSVLAAPASDLLAAQNARLIADLEAAGWTIQELEERLVRAGTPTR